MITAILKKVSLGLLRGVLQRLFGDKVLATIDNSTNNETERIRLKLSYAEKLIEADTAVRQTAMKSKIFWIVWATGALPLNFWLGLIFIDTAITSISLGIPDIPETVKPYAHMMFGSIYGSGGAVASAQLIAQGIARRK